MLTPTTRSFSFLKMYELAVGDDDARLCRDISEDHCRVQPKSFVLHIAASALSKIGDALSDARVILPWLMGLIGAPAFLIGLLVPLRESLALLPQILIGGVIRRFPVRKNFWIIASLLEGLSIAFMGLVGLLGFTGGLGGWLIVGLLVFFSLARGVASIAAKDVLGKTVSKGRRGRVNGYAAMLSGVTAGGIGFYFALSPVQAQPSSLLYSLLFGAGMIWVLAAITFSKIDEFPGATDGGRSIADIIQDQISLLIADRDLQRFLIARTLLIATSLSGPIYVTLAQQLTGFSLDGLGWLMVASGLAAAVSSAFWGKLSDKSARLTMCLGALISTFIGLGVAISLSVNIGLSHHIAFFSLAIFGLGIAHAGVRIGRKTQIIDIAGPDRKSEYVALSNTIIGVLLIIIGAITGLLMAWDLIFALIALSSASGLGGLLAMTMKNAQA